MVRRRLSRVVMIGLWRLATLGLTFGATPALGADGDLDPLFGDDGIVTTSFVGRSGEGSIGSFALARSIV